MAKRKKAKRPKRTTRSVVEDHPKKQIPKKWYPIAVRSTHKRRSHWFQARESWPWREAPVHVVIAERARAQETLPAHAGEALWESVGPMNVGGRMTSIVCHPHEPERLWAGAAGGGVWRSNDAGQTWEALWHSQASINIGSLAIDPAQHAILYCGTGEANLSADSHPGVGIYRSLNGGQSWQVLASSGGTGLPLRIGRIAVDPFDSNHILAGGVGHRLSDASGLFSSTDGGVSWARSTAFIQPFYRCHDIQFHPTVQGTVFATITAQGSKNGIWRSLNGGQTWEHLLSGLPSPDKFGRTSVAISNSNPDSLYAIADNGKGGVLGVFRSTNGGTSWTGVAGNHFTKERQMFYNNAIAVHPEDPNWVICGGVDLHRTKNGGQTWTRITDWWRDKGDPKYAHADHHAIVMPAAKPGWVFSMNDGGMDFSQNSGTAWTNRSNGLATNMFYDLEVSQSDPNFFGGGAQDNGTIATLNGAADQFQELTGGDGGWIVIDPNNSLHLFTSAQGMTIFRFRSTDGWKEVSPPENLFEMWMVFIIMKPGDSKTVFTGSRRVWRSKNDGDSWTAVSDVLDGSDITCIEIPQADPARVYVGTENGGFFRSTNGGDSWSENLASSVLPGRTITRIKARPDNADILYATVANFDSSHVFRSTDGGLTWADTDAGALPNVPHHSVAIPLDNPDTVYVCNDVGVYVSTFGNRGLAPCG